MICKGVGEFPGHQTQPTYTYVTKYCLLLAFRYTDVVRVPFFNRPLSKSYFEKNVNYKLT